MPITVTFRPRAILAAALLTAGAGAAIFYTGSTQAQPASARPAPITLGMVDMEKLINGLTELADRNAEIRTRGEVYEKELAELKKTMDSLESQLKVTIPKSDTQARTKAMADLYMTKANFEAKRNAYQQLLDLENGDILRDVYAKCSAAVAAFAQREGLDLVIFDDRSIDLPPRASMKEYESIIQSKRILFAESRLDITQRLITVMNNEYASGGRQPAPAAQPPR